MVGVLREERLDDVRPVIKNWDSMTLDVMCDGQDTSLQLGKGYNKTKSDR